MVIEMKLEYDKNTKETTLVIREEELYDLSSPVGEGDGRCEVSSRIDCCNVEGCDFCALHAAIQRKGVVLKVKVVPREWRKPTQTYMRCVNVDNCNAFVRIPLEKEFIAAPVTVQCGNCPVVYKFRPDGTFNW